MGNDSREGTPFQLDLGDLDAFGLVTQIVMALRTHAFRHSIDTEATVSAPTGWHELVIAARTGGHVMLGVRFGELSPSRWHNVDAAFRRRGWQTDEDVEGVTLRYPPGTDVSTVAFEILASLTVAGAPAGLRDVTARDSAGTVIQIET